MSGANYTVPFVGWNHEGKSDKIWGWFYLADQTNTQYVFWGRRGAKLTFKKYEDKWEVESIARKKQNSGGYKQTSLMSLERQGEGFTDDFERQFVMTRLCNTFHRNPWAA